MHYLLLSAFLYALNSFYWKTNLNTTGQVQIVWSRVVFTLIYAVIALVVSGISLDQLFGAYKQDGLLYVLAVSLGVTGLVAMLNGLKQSSLGHLSIFQAATAIVSGLGVSFIVTISGQTVIGGLFIISAFVYYHLPQSKMVFNKSFWWFLLMSLGFMLSGFVTWEIIQRQHPVISIFTQELAVFLVFTAFGVFKQIDLVNGLKSHAFKMARFAAIIFGAIYFGSFGLQITDPFLLSLSGLLSPFLTALMGVLFLKETLSKTYLFSLALMIIGIVFIST